MSALHGDIEEGVLANLLQYLALSQADGCLSLRHPARARAVVYLEQGRVVFVDAGPLRDLAALSELLRWRSGHFSFRSGVAAPERTLTDSTDRLLLEASHRCDIEPLGGGGDGSLGAESVLIAHASPDDGSALVSLSALHVWRSLDGVRNLTELAELAGLPLHVVVRGAGELLQRGLAAPAGELLVDAAFVSELTREAVDIVGPVAQVFVEDAMFDLGVEPGPISLALLDDLITSVATQFTRGDWQLDFLRRAERLRQDYGLSA